MTIFQCGCGEWVNNERNMCENPNCNQGVVSFSVTIPCQECATLTAALKTSQEKVEGLEAEVQRYEDTPPTWAELSNLQDVNEELEAKVARLVEDNRRFKDALEIIASPRTRANRLEISMYADAVVRGGPAKQILADSEEK